MKKLDESCISDYGKPFSELTEEELLDIEFSVEDYYAMHIEPKLSSLMNNIIKNTYDGNKWIIDNCYFISESDKHELAWYLSKEFIRTKHHRDQRINMIQETYKSMIPIIAQFEGLNIKKEDINVSFSKEEERVIHASEIFNEETANLFAGVFYNHQWVLFENFTNEDFCCSDNLFILNPTENLPKIYGYGLATYGITIFYPISSKLILVMMDSTKYSKHQRYKDRKIIPLYDLTFVEKINYILISGSYKYSFFSNEKTIIKYKNMCENDDIIREPASLGKVD